MVPIIFLGIYSVQKGMPFTFSHPAIVLPLKRIHAEFFSTTGLVIGSLSPDLLYFVVMDGDADFGHTLKGVFLFDIPITFIAAIIFHLWVKRILIRNLPYPFDTKLGKYLQTDFLLFLKHKWPLVAISALIGAFSHILWDKSASPHGWLYHLAPDFFSSLAPVGYMEMYLFIEWIGSILGLLVVLWVVLREKQTPTLPPLPMLTKVLYWAGIIIITGLITILKLFVTDRSYSFGPMLIVIISAGLMATVIITALFQLWPSYKKINS